MSQVSDAVIWMNAFIETIETKLPSDKQWKKLCGKIEDLGRLVKDTSVVPVNYAESDPSALDRPRPVPAPVKLKTEKSWRMLVIEELCKTCGMDTDTATDYVKNLNWNGGATTPADAVRDLIAQFPEIKSAA